MRAIIANGNTDENTPFDARIMKEELRRYGASTDKVLHQERSYSTFTEFVELVKLVAEHKWPRIGIITHEFQIPRAQEVMKQNRFAAGPVSKDSDFRAALPVFREFAPELVFVSAEAVLPLRRSCYQKIVDQAKASAKWLERTAKEKCLKIARSSRLACAPQYFCPQRGILMKVNTGNRALPHLRRLHEAAVLELDPRTIPV